MSEQAQTDSTAAAAPEQVAGETTQSTTEAAPAGEATTTETAPAEAPDDPQFAAKFAALARDERKTREGRESLKRDKAAMVEAQAELQAFKEMQAAAKDNPALMFEQFGVKPEDLIKSALAAGEEPTAESQIAGLTTKLAAMETANTAAAAEATKATEQATVKKYEADIVNYLKSEPEKYEAVNMFDAQQDVADLVVLAWQNDGIQLKVEEAAQKIEDYLVEQAQKATKLSKLKPAEEAASLPSIPVPGQSTQTPMTLSTSTGTTTPAANSGDESGLSPAERRAASLKRSAAIMQTAYAARGGS